MLVFGEKNYGTFSSHDPPTADLKVGCRKVALACEELGSAMWNEWQSYNSSSRT